MPWKSIVPQVIVLSKTRFNDVQECIDWLKERGFAFDKFVDTPASFRAIQLPVEKFRKRTFRTTSVAYGVSIINGRLI